MGSLIEQSEVRRRLAGDLALLRSLSRALAFVMRAAEQDERHRPLLCDVLSRLRAEANRHFAYQEETVGPLLRDVDAWGDARVEQLCREHEEHRGALALLANDAETGARAVDDLVGEVEWFFDRFERLMCEEDGLLEAESPGAEPSVDQIDG